MRTSALWTVWLFLLVYIPATALAAGDAYIGDTAIYTGDPGKIRPNILLIIDNSKATLNSAAGVEYIFNADELYPQEGGPNHADILAGDNQGNFTSVVVNDSFATDSSGDTYLQTLAGFSGCPEIVMHDLLEYGTYTADGSSSRPIIKANQSSCTRAPKGAVYALGNYINYTNSPPPVPIVQGPDGNDYKLIEEHLSADENRPPSGANWSAYWADNGTIETGAIWTSGTDYTFSESAQAQREIVFKAIKQVVSATRGVANFGAMVYGDNNKGGRIIYNIADLGDSSAAPDADSDGINDEFPAFLKVLPGSGEPESAPAISAGPQRPQSEALYDAGAYYGANWSPVSETSTIPAEFQQNCNNHVVFITNGLSNSEGDPKLETYIGDGDANAGPEENGTLIIKGESVPDVDQEDPYGLGVHYLDDVAYRMYQDYEMNTHMILAFQKTDNLITRAAANGKGEFHNVYNANELVESLSNLIFRMVLEEDTSFVAPVVPASTTNRTISSDRVYLGLFKPQKMKPWLGNLKKYRVSSENRLQDANEPPNNATTSDGDFITETNSFWGVDPTDSTKIMSLVENSDTLTRSYSDGDGGIITAGGAAGTLLARVRDGIPRNIYANLDSANSDLSAAGNAFVKTNTLATDAMNMADTTLRDNLIDYIHGKLDYFDHDDDGNTSEISPWPMGDILHSKPLVFHYQNYDAAKENTCYADDAAGNRSMLFVGANDGMLHAFRDCDGSEAWSFIPDNLLPRLQDLDSARHSYFVDASPTLYVHDQADDSVIDSSATTEDLVQIVFGQRRGGGTNNLTAADPRGAYYALDLTDPETPEFLWKVDASLADFAEMGETWGQPRLVKIKHGNAVKIVAFVGAGYDNNEDLRFGNTQEFPAGFDDTTDMSLQPAGSGVTTSTGGGRQTNPRGRGIFAIEIAQLDTVDGKFKPNTSNMGARVWRMTHAENSAMTYSFPTDVTALDTDADGFADTIYAGDTGGRMWRFGISDPNPAYWSSRIIFRSNPGGDSTNGRKIFFKPSVTFAKVRVLEGDQVMTRTKPVLFFGSGDRAHPLNEGVTDRIYALIDKGQGSSTLITESDLVDVTANTLQASGTTEAEVDTILSGLEAVDNYGWFIELENSGEKVLAPAVVFNKAAFFTTYTPDMPEVPDPCNPDFLGTSRVYALNVETGEAIINYYQDNDSQSTSDNERAVNEDGEVLRKEDRVKLVGEGIPSGIVTLIDASGNVTMMISSSNRVGTYSAPDSRLISPVYWMQW